MNNTKENNGMTGDQRAVAGQKPATKIEASGVCAVVTQFQLSAQCNHAAIAAQVIEVLMAGAREQGFWSGEVVPPTESGNNEFKVVQRYNSEAHALNWLNSELRVNLVNQIGGVVSVTAEVHYDGAPGCVATAIVTEFVPEMEEEYFAWESKIQVAQSKLPGYRGAYIQPPVKESNTKGWSTMLRFASPDDLETWFQSEERHNLLAESEKFVTKVEVHKLSSFPGWVPTDEAGNAPPTGRRQCWFCLVSSRLLCCKLSSAVD